MNASPKTKTTAKPGPKSTTADGNEYRDRVADLFRTKFDDVRIEEPMGGKKVDVTYREYVYGRWQTVGIECKHWRCPLGANDLSKIRSEYQDLLETGELETLIVVAPSPLGPVAQQRAKGMRNLVFRTCAQLEDDLLGLRPYFKMLSELFSGDGLSTYYIDARFEGRDEATALEHIQRWINGPNAYPLAILGGYGKGKTSLAKRVVAEQAAKHLKDVGERMPILIGLGETTHETTLEGLFGREFTSRHPALGFRFETLWHLNNKGRLLIVLDGFDEMKHGMTVNDFNANFHQFNRLVVPNSRVLILGRPNSLPSEIRTQVLRGIRVVDEVEIAAPGRKKWSEVAISSFNEFEIRKFLLQYLRHLTSTTDRNAHVLKEEGMVLRVDEIVAKVPFDLLCRPVHAKIIAELAVDPVFNLAGITEYKLYNEFLRQIVERDACEKPARNNIKIAHRLRFQEELAYWAWTRVGESQGAFYRVDVPPSLLEGLGDGGTVDTEGKLNEYLVSTVTEEKQAGQLIFGHRSFQEFLVAQKVRRLGLSEIDHAELSRAIGPGVAAFLVAGPSVTFLETWFVSLPDSKQTVSLTYLSLFAHSNTVIKEVKLLLHSKRQTFEVLGIIGTLLRMNASGQRRAWAIEVLLESIRTGDSPLQAGFALYLLIGAPGRDGTWARVLSAVLRRSQGRQNRVRQASERAGKITFFDDPSYDLTIRHTKWSTEVSEKAVLWNARRTQFELRDYLRKTGRLLVDDDPSVDGNESELNDGPICITVSQLEEQAHNFDVLHVLDRTIGPTEIN